MVLSRLGSRTVNEKSLDLLYSLMSLETHGSNNRIWLCSIPEYVFFYFFQIKASKRFKEQNINEISENDFKYLKLMVCRVLLTFIFYDIHFYLFRNS